MANEPFYSGPWGPRSVMSDSEGYIDFRSSYKAMILADGPVGYWRLGEASGSIGDSSGNNNSGAVTGTPTYSVTPAIPPDPNKAITFAATDFFTVAGPPAVLVIAGSWTVEGWAKVNAQVGPNTIVGLRDATNSINYHLVLVGHHIAIYTGNGTNQSNITTSTTDDDNLWHHFAGSWDGTNLRLYKDGLLVAGPTVPAFPPTTIGTQAFMIASQLPGPTNPMVGSIDEVAVYNKLLAPTRILQHALGSPAATGYNRNM